MRCSTAVFVVLFSGLAGTVAAVPTEVQSGNVGLARQDGAIINDSDLNNSTSVSGTELADTSSTDSSGSTGAVGGLLSGLTSTVGGVVDGVTGAVGNVADGVTGTNAVGDLLGGVTDTAEGVVNGVVGAAGSVVDGVTGTVGLRRNAKRALLRRRLDAKHFTFENLA